MNNPLGVLILMAGGCLAFFYGLILLLWSISMNAVSFELVLLIFLFVGSLGLMFRREAARRVMIAVNVLAVVYLLGYVFSVKGGVNFLSLQFLTAAIIAIIFYSLPPVRKYYQGDLKAPGRTILMVDDDRTFLLLMKKYLSSRGVRIITAMTGQEGMDLAVRHRPDLILLDVVLPDIDGREVCSRLKETSSGQDIPIVFLTVKDSSQELRDEFEAGGAMHLQKPIPPETLWQSIEKLLGSRG